MTKYNFIILLVVFSFNFVQAEDEWEQHDRSLVCTEGALENFDSVFTWPVYINYQNIISELAKGNAISDARCIRNVSKRDDLIVNEGNPCTLIDSQDVLGKKYEVRLEVGPKVIFKRKISNGIEYLIATNPEAIKYSFGRPGKNLNAGEIIYVCVRKSVNYKSDILMQYKPTNGQLEFVNFLEIN